MLTPPSDLDELDLVEALRVGWDFEAVSLRYTRVGFGSHHWIAQGPGGVARFVTVDSLIKLRAGADPKPCGNGSTVPSERPAGRLRNDRVSRDLRLACRYVRLSLVLPRVRPRFGTGVLHGLSIRAVEFSA
jgi:hypothetical protein